ncbi:MAG: transferrin-binding protein-like solute binding protein [Proteobacteria bacterium]|nr:transferrin-binding protein-like solute binding protein [Pseudomonadota bacterium]
MRICIVFALSAGLVACGGSPAPSAESRAIEEYTRIASNSTHILITDWIHWRPGSTEPERVSVDCRGEYCETGDSRTQFANRVVDVDPEQITILPDTNGISTGIENFVGFGIEAHNFVGWMEHSLFVSTSRTFTGESHPDKGSIRVFATVSGNAPLTNPEVEATWTGFVSARDDTAGTTRDSYVTGDARISVRIGEQVMADVHLTDMVNATTGQQHGDLVYEDMSVIGGQFGRYHADNHRLSGVFYGPNHEEVGGIFEHPQGLLGAYGGDKD